MQQSKGPDIRINKLRGLPLHKLCPVMVGIQEAGCMGLFHEVTNVENGLDRRRLKDLQLGLCHGVPDVIKVHVIPEKGQQDRD